MIRVDKLRGVMAEKNISGLKMAKLLNMAPKTFYDKMKKGVFGSDEIDNMVDILELEQPWNIFLVKK